jgi:pilus assembly protein Flp/PilA
MLEFFLTLKHMVDRRLNGDEGATAVEYGLMVSLIAIVIIVAVTAIGVNLAARFAAVAAAL